MKWYPFYSVFNPNAIQRMEMIDETRRILLHIEQGEEGAVSMFCRLLIVNPFMGKWCYNIETIAWCKSTCTRIQYWKYMAVSNIPSYLSAHNFESLLKPYVRTTFFWQCKVFLSLWALQKYHTNFPTLSSLETYL